MKTVADVTDAEIEAAFRGTDFGVANLRNVLDGPFFYTILNYCQHTKQVNDHAPRPKARHCRAAVRVWPEPLNRR